MQYKQLVKSLAKRRTLQKREPSVLKACSRVQENKKERKLLMQLNSTHHCLPFSKINNFCNTGPNKIARKDQKNKLFKTVLNSQLS
jgi:hypothetical protein